MSSSHAFLYDSDHEDDEVPFVYDGKDVTIFVVDSIKEMFENLECEEANSLYDLTLHVIEELLLKKLRSNHSNELVSVLLYNTKKADTKHLIAPDKCAVLFPLQSMNANMVKVIKNTRESEDYNDFTNKYGHSTDAKIADVLWMCSSIKSETKVRNLMIYWFTSIPIPHFRGSPLFREAMDKAEEFQYLQPDFQLIQLNTEFNFDQFYKTFTSQLTGKDEDEIIEPPIDFNLTSNEMVDKIVARLSRIDYKNRALANITMEISEQMKFGVGVYNFTRKKSEPRSVQLDRVTKQPIEAKRYHKYGAMPNDEQIDEDLDRSIVLNERLTADKSVKFIEVGGEKIKFTPLEVYESKQVMQPKIKLLGFKPISTLNRNLHLRNPLFIYPSEKLIKGSTAVFRALWESCLKLDKYALCIFTMRLKSFSRVVALIPQCENSKINTFDGFQMEFLPYASDIRDLQSLYCKQQQEVVGDELLTEVCDFVKKLKLSYEPSMIKNPYIDKCYSRIESTVFSEDHREIEDNSMPRLSHIDQRIGNIVEKIKETINGFDAEAASAAKRKAADPQGGTRAKKVATTEVNAEMILEKCKSGEVKNITVAMLKDYLKAKNVAGFSKLTKDDLITKILELP